MLDPLSGYSRFAAAQLTRSVLERSGYTPHPHLTVGLTVPARGGKTSETISNRPMPPTEIREIMSEIGLSCQTLARVLGVTRRTVSRWRELDGEGCLYAPAALLLRLLRQHPEYVSLIRSSVRHVEIPPC